MATRARPGPVEFRADAPPRARPHGGHRRQRGIIIGADVTAHAEPLAIGLGAALCATGLTGWLPRPRA